MIKTIDNKIGGLDDGIEPLMKSETMEEELIEDSQEFDKIVHKIKDDKLVKEAYNPHKSFE